MRTKGEYYILRPVLLEVLSLGTWWKSTFPSPKAELDTLVTEPAEYKQALQIILIYSCVWESLTDSLASLPHAGY